jgi:GT2 family glycosyltransferase
VNFPRVSVIVPTYGREKVLVETLVSLLACQYPQELWELLVIDQTKVHALETEAFLVAQPTLHWFRPPQVGFASLTRARNFGIAHADSPDVILFVDDDVEVERDFIERHAQAYEDRSVGAAVGRVLVPGERQMAQPGAPVGRISWFGAFVNNYESIESVDAGNLIGCNFSLRAQVLAKTGPFDERFVGNALREDSDMAVRVVRAGFRIRFLPEALTLHKQDPRGGTRSQTDRIKWYYALFYNNFLFYAKFAKPWRLPFFVLHMWRPIFACAFWYGKARPEALATPWRGIRDGIRAACR